MSRTLRKISTAYLVLIASLVIFVCYALALTIPSTPLFVSTVQQPNVLLLLDVSPSMQCTAWASDYNPEAGGVTLNVFDANYDWNILVKVGSKLIMVYHDDTGALRADKENLGGLNITIGTNTVSFPDPATGKARAYFPEAIGSVPVGEYPCYIYDGKYLNWAFQNNKDLSSYTNTRLGALIDPSSTNSLNQFVKNNPTFRFGLMVTGPNGTNSGFLKKSCGTLTDSNVDTVLGKDNPGETSAYTSNDYLLDPDNTNSFYKKNRLYVIKAGSSDGASSGTNDCQIGEALTETWQVFHGGSSSYNGSESYTSPITASCQANFVVLFSSGRPHWDNVYDKYSISTSSSDDFQTATPLTSGSGVTYTATNFDTRAPAIATYMKLNTPRSDITGSKTILTYTVGVGYNYPSATASDTNGLLQKIASNGGGTFSTANSASGLGAALNAVGAGVVQAISSASSVAVNTAFLQTNTQLFTAQFLPGIWEGDVIAKNIDSGTGDITTQAWNASSLLLARSESSRSIFTTYSTSSNRYTYTRFDYQANTETEGGDGDTGATLLGRLQTWLGTADSTDTEKVVKTVRGTYSGASSTFANGYRELPKSGGNIKKLGDVVSSSPVFVGPPPFYYSYAGYRQFQVNNQGRKGMVYIGGNDGMLHAFFAGTSTDATFGDPGAEVWSYIPNNLMRGPNPSYNVSGDQIANTPRRVKSLARPENYGTFSNTVQYGTASLPHQMMVNGTATLGDAVVGFQNYSTPKWGSVLVGTEREGGKGVFALNVTDPRKPNSTANSLGQTGVTPMWEYSDYHDPAMGYTYSSVAIARLRYSAPQEGGYVPQDTWVAIFGNGYNSYEGKAYLMVVDIKTGKLIRKILTDNTTDNGLSSPAVIVDGSGYVKYAYAGDLKGRIYRFDFKSSSTPAGSGQTKWDNYVASWDSTLLFTARNASNQEQPITVAPDVAYDGTKYIILFGTGRYIDPSDITNTNVQTIYGVFDPGTYSGILRANLVSRTMSATTPLAGQSIRYVTGAALGSNDKGWYIDLPDSGERVITDPVAYSGNVIFTSFIPTTTACEYGGYSWLNVVDFKTGLQPVRTDLDITGEGTINSDDTITVSGTTYNPSSLKFTGAGMASSPTVLSASGGLAYKYTTLSSGVVTKTTEAGSATAGNNFVRAWREIFPYSGI